MCANFGCSGGQDAPEIEGISMHKTKLEPMDIKVHAHIDDGVHGVLKMLIHVSLISMC